MEYFDGLFTLQNSFQIKIYMKKLLFGAAALILMASCSGNGTSSEKDTEDSTRIADSIAQVEAAKAAAEQARLDSIRQDSIKQDSVKNEELKKFHAAIPNYKKFFSEQGYSSLSSYLKKLGYVGSTKEVPTMDGPKLKGNFKFNAGKKSIDIQYEQLMGRMSAKITFNGDQEALSKFYKDAKKLQGRADWWQCNVSQKGNTVIIDGGMD